MIGFYLKQKRVLAFGLANTKNSKFIVCAGSNIRNSQAGNMSVYRTQAFNLRKRLLKNGTISPSLIFLKAYEFKNISEATSVILGGSRSGNAWRNANDESYPKWANPNRQKLFGAMFKKGSRFTTNNNETFLIRDVVENRGEDGKKIYEYLLRPKGGTKADDLLMPESEVIKSLKALINQEIRGGK